MTGRQDRWKADYQPRAADSAACLLVVGGYEEYGTSLRRAVVDAGQRVLMSPALGDFIEVRFCDLGPRPSRAGRGTPEVARLVLELTSRPRDVARNFSAVLVFDESASVVDHLLQACAGDPALRQLNARCLGIASREDRPERATGSARTPDDIVMSRGGKWKIDEFIVQIYALAERLLNDFGSGWQPGVRPEEVSRLGSVVEPAARGIIARSPVGEEARSAPRRNGRAEDDSLAAAKRKASERQERAAMEAAAQEREVAAQRAEAERQAEVEQLAAARQQIANLEREVADLRRARPAAATGDAPPPDGQPSDALPSNGSAIRSGEAAPRPAIEAPTAPDPGGDQKSERPFIPPKELNDSPTGSGADQAPEQGGDASEDRPGPRFQRIKEIGGGLVGRVRGAQSADPAATDGVAELLSECVRRLKEKNQREAETCLAVLRRYAIPEIPVANRELYRKVMIEDRALSLRLPGPLATDFYDVLLRLVYGQPLGYRQYRDLEYCLELAGEGALPPALSLIKAIDRALPTDPFVLAVTRYYLGQARPDERVRPRPGDTRRLIDALAEAPLARADVGMVFAVLSRYLGEVRTSSERKEIAGLLRSCGYLATPLARSCPDELPGQVAQLSMLLRWAYPNGLGRRDVETLIGSVVIATSALLPAVLRTLARPGERPWTIREFLRKYSGRDVSLRQAAELEPEFMSLSLGSRSVGGELPAGP